MCYFLISVGVLGLDRFDDKNRLVQKRLKRAAIKVKLMLQSTQSRTHSCWNARVESSESFHDRASEKTKKILAVIVVVVGKENEKRYHEM